MATEDKHLRSRHLKKELKELKAVLTPFSELVVPQQRVESFVPAFVDAFQKSDWLRYSNGDDWP